MGVTDVIDINLVSLLITFSRHHTLFWCFHSKLSTSKYWLVSALNEITNSLCLLALLKFAKYFSHKIEAYSEPCQASKMERFAEKFSD